MAHSYRQVLRAGPKDFCTQGIETLTAENVDEIGAMGRRPLHVALATANFDDLEKILELGANPYAKSGPSRFDLIKPMPPEAFIGMYPELQEKTAALKDRLKQAQEKYSEIILLDFHLCCDYLQRLPADQTPDAKVAMAFIDAAGQGTECLERYPRNFDKTRALSPLDVMHGFARLTGIYPISNSPPLQGSYKSHKEYKRGLPPGSDEHLRARHARAAFQEHFFVSAPRRSASGLNYR